MSPSGRRTRSGAEFSPFSLSSAVALSLPNIRISELLARRDDGPDSDTESDDDDASDDDEDDGASEPVCVVSPGPPKGSIIRVPRNGQPTHAPTPGAAMPGSVIRCAPRKKANASIAAAAAQIATACKRSASAKTPAPKTPAPSHATAKKPRSTRPDVQANKLAKKHARDRRVRLDDREQRRAKAQTALKGIALVRLRRAVPLAFDIRVGEQFHAPIASSGWQAVRQDEHDPQTFDLDELLASDSELRVLDWQGEPTPVVDADRNIFFCLGGFPDNGDEDWDADVAVPAAEGMQRAAIEVYTLPRWLRKRTSGKSTPRRGGHASKSAGASMGGGQVHPQNLALTAVHAAVLASLFASKPFRRIAGFTNMIFTAFAKQLHGFYAAEFEKVCAHDANIRRNLPRHLSVFSTTTFNFGPATVTLPHIDFRNLAWGWCAITALGNYNPDRGGHLVLWDLKLVIRFPPGATILIPSAILRHSNVNIGRNETRFSFTQYTPAGIFRWAYNKFRTDKDINTSKTTTPEEREQRRKDRARRWAEGIKMYSKWEGPTRTL
ncbi:hypothetical protein R3P38DRAFT_3200796 [Favolaschia claudopus]|uniref:Uncharacterized protein n=1 Tax=Favolaschia claudopus TaxID=2862362 RepID=A0AAW0AYN8_9AGAR